MRIAVVGMGGTGSAAARFLAEAGHEVHAFEQFQIGHERGSSHGASRIIRYTYPDPLYTALMGEAYPLWERLERDAGESLLVKTGGVFFGRADSVPLRQAIESLRVCRRPHEVLSRSDALARFPAFHLDPDETALVEPDTGFLRASACVAAQVRLAVRAGATLRENTPIVSIRTHTTPPIVTLASGDEIPFDRVIVTAGPWMGKLLATLALPLTVTQQTVVYLEPNAPFSLPVVWIDLDSLFYGFPPDGRIPGVKLAEHVAGRPIDPDAARDPDAQAAAVGDAVAYAARRMPALAGARVAYSQTCLYTNTPDEDFRLGSPPGQPDVFVVSGCSGHGFKFTVLLGRIAADWASGDGPARDLSRFRLAR